MIKSIEDVVLEIWDCLDTGTDGSGFLDNRRVKKIIEARDIEVIKMVEGMKLPTMIKMNGGREMRDSFAILRNRTLDDILTQLTNNK